MHLNYTSFSNLLNLGYKINENWIYTKHESPSLLFEEFDHDTNKLENTDLETTVYSSFFLIISLSISLHSFDLSGSFKAK